MASSHPIWIRFVSPLIAGLMLLAILLFPNVYIFLSVIVVWFLFFFFLHYRYHVARHQTALSGMTAMSFIILLILVETIWLRWFFVGLSFPVFFFIAYWWEPRIEKAVHIKEKPLRRIMMMLFVFNVYALLLGLFAMYLYFPSVPFWILSFAGGIYAALGSYMIWNLYFKIPLHEIIVWNMIVALVVIELMWVLRLLPFGYLALGFLTVWVWYILQLFIRFHLGSKGILWKEQRAFVVVNVLLYIAVLYVIRWV